MLNVTNFKTLPVPAIHFFQSAATIKHAGSIFSLPVFWYINTAKSGRIGVSVRALRPFFWVQKLSEKYLPGSFLSVNYSTNKTVTLTVRPSDLFFIASFLKNSMFFGCQALTDIWAVDYPTRDRRFEITYSLLGNKKNIRIYLKTFVNEWDVTPSLTSLYQSAAWLEREVWDMFGISFSGHPDLRRILTDYGFFGFPLRKDFPLTGFSELRYDDTTRRVASEHLNLIQELRLFFFATPWRKK